MMHLSGRVAIALLATTLAGCATREGVPRPFPGAALPPTKAPTPVPAVPVPADPPAPIAGTAPLPGDPAVAIVVPDPADVVATALGYRGVPYRFGGSDPAGFDCSGFVQYVFKQAGTSLPREVRDQFQVGDEIDRDEVQPGDLVFFRTGRRGASHVGLAIGDGQFIHAPNSNGVVRVEPLAGRYWATRFVGARRIDRAPIATQ
jgi:cell wall-associated NlpC family hydrolase